MDGEGAARRVWTILGMAAVGVAQAAGVGMPSASAAVPAPAPAAALERFVISPQESTVTYRVPETFFETNQFTIAVGTTHAVTGEILVDRAHPRNSKIGTITVDISTFQSDRPRRDRAIREKWLESAKYPIAQFTPMDITGLPATAVEGREMPIQIMGNLKIRTTVRPVAFSGSVTLQQNTLRGTARTTIRMTDFGFDPPSLLGILKAENTADLQLSFSAHRAP
jgi:polyisoprenoid-binding protein YceI